MNVSIAVKRLWWKEFSQLRPLAMMLIVMAAISFLLVTVGSLMVRGQSYQTMAEMAEYLLLISPSIFALGVGGFLVGNEKETHTLSWLQSLPIAPRDVIMTKLLCGLAGLGAAWIVFGGLYLLHRSMTGLAETIYGSDLLVWGSTSVYLLVLGMGLSWAIRSPLVSLLAVVPLCFVPTVLAVLPVTGYQFTDRASLTIAVWTLLATLVSLYVTVVAGHRALSPASTGRRWRVAELGLARPQACAWSRYTAVEQPWTALIWQTTHQNWLWLTGCSVLMLVAWSVHIVCELDRAFGSHPSGMALYLPPVTLLFWICAASWLSAVPFVSDTRYQRIRFMADRGVSPTLIWLTRHLLPTSFLTASAIAAAMISYAMASSMVCLFLWDPKLGGQPPSVQFPIEAMLVAFMVGAMVYVCVQWFGQIAFTPLLTSIASPLVGVVGLMWFAFAYLGLSTPIWLLGLMAIVPLVTTWWNAGDWIDRRFGKRFWTANALGLMTILMVPCLAYTISVVTQPGMSPKIESELEQAAEALTFPPPTPMMVALILDKKEGPATKSSPDTATPADDSPRLSSDESRQRNLGYFKLLLKESDQPCILNYGVYNYLTSLALLCRSNAAASEQPQSVAREQYRESIDVLMTIASRVRQNSMLNSQDMADSVEIFLLHEALLPEAKQQMGYELYSRLVRQLGDRDSRRSARRRAVACSWLVYKKSWYHPIGDRMHELESIDNIASYRTSRQNFGPMLAELWTICSDDSGTGTVESLQRLRRLQGYDQPLVVTRSLRVEDARQFRFLAGAAGGGIAIQWNAGWESQATKLLRQLKTTDNQ
ncbi:MAG: hypothetical protein KF752_06370 [Pirellulaceae bacterium]|nr:hypothetical protein [Pirellulaceae bacterium]